MEIVACPEGDCSFDPAKCSKEDLLIHIIWKTGSSFGVCAQGDLDLNALSPLEAVAMAAHLDRLAAAARAHLMNVDLTELAEDIAITSLLNEEPPN